MFFQSSSNNLYQNEPLAKKTANFSFTDPWGVKRVKYIQYNSTKIFLFPPLEMSFTDLQYCIVRTVSPYYCRSPFIITAA
jgi:hypothetical protein